VWFSSVLLRRISNPAVREARSVEQFASIKLPIITLTTDFGLTDAYVGAMKGVILSIAPHAQMVDLCHQVPAQDIRAAAFVLYQAAPFFPADTIHLAVVDPGVGSQRRALAVSTNYGIYVAPDNGVLSYVLAVTDCQAAVSLDNADYWLPGPSETFHGRDIFAPVAAHLAAGVPLSRLGTPVEGVLRLPFPQAEMQPAPLDQQGTIAGEMVAHVLHIDHFGNLIMDVVAGQLPAQPVFQVAGHMIRGLSRNYADGAPGDWVAYVGSTREHVEIAQCSGNAAQATGAGLGTPVVIRSGNI
jgi:S-adenosyl-L-methionine hydrolase (adenosine-forming)